MGKIDRQHPTPRFLVRRDVRSGKFVLENRKTGKRLPLKGYGTLGEGALPKDADVDLTRPIYEQVIAAKRKAKPGGAKSPSRNSRRK